jgi:hypothetical protein
VVQTIGVPSSSMKMVGSMPIIRLRPITCTGQVRRKENDEERKKKKKKKKKAEKTPEKQRPRVREGRGG